MNVKAGGSAGSANGNVIEVPISSLTSCSTLI